MIEDYLKPSGEEVGACEFRLRTEGMLACCNWLKSRSQQRAKCRRSAFEWKRHCYEMLEKADGVVSGSTSLTR